MKTEIFNFFREVFKVPFLEQMLKKLVSGKESTAFVSKLVPNNYQYAPNTIREFDYCGIRLKLDIHDYIGHYLYFGFRDASHEKLMSLVNSGNVVLDIGTNYGTTILQFAKIVGDDGMAYGFEPDPINFAICESNLKLNGFTNIQVEQTGLGSRSGTVTLVVDTESNRGGNRVSTETENKESHEIKISRLDDWVLSKHLPKVDLIKIDVEGYEMEVLKGSEGLLTRFRPVLFVELDDNNLRLQNSSARELIQFLESLDYSVVESETFNIVTADSDFEDCHYDALCTNRFT